MTGAATGPRRLPGRSLAYLLAAVVMGCCTAQARLEARDDAFIGYTEREGGGTLRLVGGADGPGAAAGSSCPGDDKPDHCSAWARNGECLHNPSFMRKHCKASCRVVARCFAAATGPWPGHATAAGTRRFAAGASEAAAGHFRQHVVHYSGVDPSPGNLTLSSLGVGTYLGGSDEATDEAATNAILKSIASGWNVVDTAANYRGGRAEAAAGCALSSLRLMGDAERDQLFVATKAGYPAEGLLEQLLQAGAIQRADVVRGHSLHPALLQASLHRSLAALGLRAVDILYLHNPAEAQLATLGREAFMQRLRAAFQFCEQARAAGSIRAYGIASWSCFRLPPSSAGHLSLQAVVELAREVGGTDHGFRYIQLPVSAGMPEAWAQPWQELAQGGPRLRVSLTQAAHQLGIGIFSSGPLLQGQHLKDVRLQHAMQRMPQLQRIESTAPRLLHWARSTPGLLSTLVGHKAADHVRQNCALTEEAPLSEEEHAAAAKQLIA